MTLCLLSGLDQITVLNRTITADAVPLPSATQPFSRRERLSPVTEINGLPCLCPDLTHAKVALLLENRNNSIGTVIDAIHRTGRPRPMRRLADPDLLRFMRRIRGTRVQEYSLK